jgi:hypothetical protein
VFGRARFHHEKSFLGSHVYFDERVYIEVLFYLHFALKKGIMI